MIYLALDYDHVPYSRVFKELLRLKHNFDITLSIYQSSTGSYHIRSKEPIDNTLAFEILEHSNCSWAYKDFCKRTDSFPIRTSEKTCYYADGRIETKPAPTLLYSI